MSWALVLQLLALAALSLGLAGPVFDRDVDVIDTLVILEGGIAMTVRDEIGGESRFERALVDLASVVEDNRGRISVWLAGTDPRPVVIDGDDPVAMSHAIGRLLPADTAVDWGAMVDRVAPSIGGFGRLIVFTTDPEEARAALAARADLSHLDLQLRSFTGPFANFGFGSASVVKGEAPGRWFIEASIRAIGMEVVGLPSIEVVASFTPHGAQSPLEFGRQRLSFALSGVARPAFTLDLPGPGLLELRVEVEDAVASDDSYRVWLDHDAQTPSIVVFTAAPVANPLVRALEAQGAVVGVTTAWPVPYHVDLLIVDGAADPWLEGGVAMESSRPRAILWIGSAPGFAGGVRTARDPGIASWNVDHQITRGTTWGSTAASRAIELPRLLEGVTLVDGISGPLVEARALREGRDLVISFNTSDRDWTNSAAFVTVLADALAWLAPSPAAVTACIAGITCRVPFEVAASGGSLTLEDAATWQWPQFGTRLPLAITDAWAPEQAGAWAFAGPGQTRVFPVNIGPGALAAIWATVESEAAGTVSWREPVSAGLGSLRWLILIAALLVVVEGVLAGRGGEGFWKGASWRGPGPAARRRKAAAVGHVLVLTLLIIAVLGAPWLQFRTDQHLIVVTSGDSETVELPSAVSAWPAAARTDLVMSHLGGSAVDLEAVLRAALAAVPPEAQARIFLAPSSGPTRGDHFRLVSDLASPNIGVDLLLPASADMQDVVAEGLWLEETPRSGDTVTLQGSIRSPTAVRATLRFYRDGDLVIERSIDLAEGRSLVEVPITFDAPGDVVFLLEVVSESDPIADNNRATTLITVGPPPSVAIVGAEVDARAFADALVLQGFDAIPWLPRDVGLRNQDYLGVDGIVLLNVPASEFTTFQLAALERYVRELGGGVVLTGGEHAFGPGGYYQTSLDRMSPLSSQVPREAPEVAMLFVLDRSGSMQQSVGATTRLELAKEATMSAIELLGDRSEVAIVAFDEEAHLVLPFTSSSAMDVIRDSLAPLTPGGGTSIYPGLRVAASLLEGVEASTKHVLVMTDGLSQPGAFAEVIAQIVALDATVSTVAIGLGADAERIREIASLGGGTSHVTSDFGALPSILAQETLLLSGDPVVRTSVVPRRAEDANGLLDGLTDVFPPIAGFVETTAKADADVTLEDEEERPLMAVWSYGAGRVVAFGSEAVGPWASEWMAISSFPRWWGQWVRWAAQSSPTAGLDVRAFVVNDEVLVDVIATGLNSERLTGLLLEAAIHPDQGDPTWRIAPEVGLGRYEARLPLPLGRSRVQVGLQTESGDLSQSVSVYVHREYPAAMAGGGDMQELGAFVSVTGGRVLLNATEPWDFPRRFLLAISRDAWRPWVVIGLAGWMLWLVHRFAPTVLGFRRTRFSTNR